MRAAIIKSQCEKGGKLNHKFSDILYRKVYDKDTDTEKCLVET